ncbi:hypothetical protein [Agitococcus lubricus]|uniref:AP2 domain-containing protein n=1 Tax=Agitococcus lubricus TaxID=1077255 RepID=A0A2T5IZM4_9GAMM|nr:hypothetical protein [Agitococcus lubricus]PTQ89516.1 hypothetical protein C8N29_10647 [Agitococcus lubricus]
MAIQYIHNKITDEMGYQVRVKGRTRYFSIKKYGGKRKTLKLAKIAEKEILDEMGLKSSSEKTMVTSMIRNTSGVLGLQVQWRSFRGSENVYPYITGSWRAKDGKAHIFGYSIEKHGLKGAIQLATAKRKAAGLYVMDVDEAVQILQKHVSC